MSLMSVFNSKPHVSHASYPHPQNLGQSFLYRCNILKIGSKFTI